MQPTLSVALVGSVDHGKSSVLGRLLHETDQLPDGKLAELEAISAKRGMPIEWSFVLDAFQAERDQAITIDVTQVRLKARGREWLIIDAPGHHEFLRNMVSGAAAATAAVLLVDAKEGVREQTLRHCYLLKLLDVRQVVVAINKMDLVDYAEPVFLEIANQVRRHLHDLDLSPLAVIPVSARQAVNLVRSSPETPWYEGAPLLEACERFVPPEPLDARPLRLPIQDVYKFDDRRIIAGRISAGHLSVGDRIVFSPSGKTGEIASLEHWSPNTPEKKYNARAGENVAITLKEQAFVERGELISHADAVPKLTHAFDADVFWLGPGCLKLGDTLTLKFTTRHGSVRVQDIRHVVDTSSLATRQAQVVNPGEMAVVTLRSAELLAVDDYALIPPTGRFVLLAGYDVVGGGIIDARRYPDQRAHARPVSQNLTLVGHKIAASQRTARYGHRGAVIWLTGLSGAGKSTLSMELERRLFQDGCAVYVLDGDNVRHGLSANLGFSPEDRKENIRRVGEVAALFADAGLVCVTAFISPYRDDRAMTRAAVKTGAFYEVHVKADLATCESRDPKGLYAKARRGELTGMTGIDSPYEAPESPDLVVDTTHQSVEESVAQLLGFVQSRILGGLR